MGAEAVPVPRGPGWHQPPGPFCPPGTAPGRRGVGELFGKPVLLPALARFADRLARR
jgi:hypothetical protein